MPSSKLDKEGSSNYADEKLAKSDKLMDEDEKATLETEEDLAENDEEEDTQSSQQKQSDQD